MLICCSPRSQCADCLIFGTAVGTLSELSDGALLSDCRSCRTASDSVYSLKHCRAPVAHLSDACRIPVGLSDGRMSVGCLSDSTVGLSGPGLRRRAHVINVHPAITPHRTHDSSHLSPLEDLTYSCIRGTIRHAIRISERLSPTETVCADARPVQTVASGHRCRLLALS